MAQLSQADQVLIAEAVAKAEAATSGEILCVLAHEVSEYREVPLAWAAGAALVLPALAVLLGLPLPGLAQASGWTAAHGPRLGPNLAAAFAAYAAFQAVVFVAVALLVSIPHVRRALTPRSLKQRRVHRAAVQHFAGVGLHLRPEVTGVLIFAALEDRRVEIVADAAIHAKVGQARWDQAIAATLETARRDGPAAGLVRAVEICGAALADHFPDDGRPNAYPDQAVEV